MSLFAAVALLLAGCRSATSTDLVEREMRCQEDKIYAMQDYLADYEQLLCEYRRENAELKQQLVQSQFKSGPVEDKDRGNAVPGPDAAAPPRFRSSEPPAAPDSTSPEVPQFEREPPGVPPLNDASLLDPQTHQQLASRHVTDTQPDDSVQLAGFAADPGEPQLEPAAGPPDQVVLRGEVILDDSNSGPRVRVDVTPIRASGRAATFNGRLSLMILDKPTDGAEQNIARWEFTADDVAQIVRKSGGGATLDFPLQLPADAPVDRPVEIWARLMPDGGRKVLAHASVDLGRPGWFASNEYRPRPVVDYAVRSASAEVVDARASQLDADDNGWRVARPNVPGLDCAGATSDGKWRAATQPIPIVQSRPVVDIPLVSSVPLPSRQSPRPDKAADEATLPDWSPERPQDTASSPQIEHITPPAVPVWTPTR